MRFVQLDRQDTLEHGVHPSVLVKQIISTVAKETATGGPGLVLAVGAELLNLAHAALANDMSFLICAEVSSSRLSSVKEAAVSLNLGPVQLQVVKVPASVDEAKATPSSSPQLSSRFQPRTPEGLGWFNCHTSEFRPLRAEDLMAVDLEQRVKVAVAGGVGMSVHLEQYLLSFLLHFYNRGASSTPPEPLRSIYLQLLRTLKTERGALSLPAQSSSDLLTDLKAAHKKAQAELRKSATPRYLLTSITSAPTHQGGRKRKGESLESKGQSPLKRARVAPAEQGVEAARKDEEKNRQEALAVAARMQEEVKKQDEERKKQGALEAAKKQDEERKKKEAFEAAKKQDEDKKKQEALEVAAKKKEKKKKQAAEVAAKKKEEASKKKKKAVEVASKKKKEESKQQQQEKKGRQAEVAATKGKKEKRGKSKNTKKRNDAEEEDAAGKAAKEKQKLLDDQASETEEDNVMEETDDERGVKGFVL